MYLNRRSDEPSSSGHRTRLGVIGKCLTGVSAVVVLVATASGISAAVGGVQPTITTTDASFVIPQGPQVPPIGTTWMLKLQDLTSTKLVGTTSFITTEAQPTSTLDIAVPTVEGCNFQVDVRTTPAGQPVSTTSGSFYSDLIMMVPGCGNTPTTTTTTTTTTTRPTDPTTTTTLPTTTTTAPPTHSTGVVASATQLPFTADTSATTTPASQLPFTGANYAFLGGLGLLLVGLGYLLMRRRSVKLSTVGRAGGSDSEQ
jgi:hypothetical protein